MTMPTRLADEAVADLDRIIAWYDRRDSGLGQRFADDLIGTVDRITHFPDAYARVHRSIRRARVGRFPYFVAYELFGGDVVILGVFAEAQHPARVIERVAEA